MPMTGIARDAAEINDKSAKCHPRCRSQTENRAHAEVLRCSVGRDGEEDKSNSAMAAISAQSNSRRAAQLTQPFYISRLGAGPIIFRRQYQQEIENPERQARSKTPKTRSHQKVGVFGLYGRAAAKNPQPTMIIGATPKKARHMSFGPRRRSSDRMDRETRYKEEHAPYTNC